MSAKLVPFKCPNCGKALHVEDGAENVFCTYCGSPLHVQRKNHFFFHYVNEAKLRKAEADEKVKLKQIEAKEREAKRLDRNQWIAVAVGLLVAFALIAIGYMH